MLLIDRPDSEIAELEAWAAEGQANGTRYGGMSYEDGIRDTLDWLMGRKKTGPHQGE
jgi:hypothetical protein